MNNQFIPLSLNPVCIDFKPKTGCTWVWYHWWWEYSDGSVFIAPNYCGKLLVDVILKCDGSRRLGHWFRMEIALNFSFLQKLLKRSANAMSAKYDYAVMLFAITSQKTPKYWNINCSFMSHSKLFVVVTFIIPSNPGSDIVGRVHRRVIGGYFPDWQKSFSLTILKSDVVLNCWIVDRFRDRRAYSSLVHNNTIENVHCLRQSYVVIRNTESDIKAELNL